MLDAAACDTHTVPLLGAADCCCASLCPLRCRSKGFWGTASVQICSVGALTSPSQGPLVLVPAAREVGLVPERWLPPGSVADSIPCCCVKSRARTRLVPCAANLPCASTPRLGWIVMYCVVLNVCSARWRSLEIGLELETGQQIRRRLALYHGEILQPMSHVKTLKLQKACTLPPLLRGLLPTRA